MYPLWGSTPAQNHQLLSGDYAVAQGMFFRAYQRHQRSTMHIEKSALSIDRNVMLRQPRYPTSAAKESQETLLSQQQKTAATKHRQVHQQSHQEGCFTGKLPFQNFWSFAPNTFNVSLLQALTKPTFVFTKGPTNKE